MTTYDEKLDRVLYAIFQICKGIPNRTQINIIKITLHRNHADFNLSEIVPLLTGLEEQGYIERKMFQGEGGLITLNSTGIRKAESYKKKITPGTAENTQWESYEFLKACGEKTGNKLGHQFNGYEVGDQLGFDREKTKQYIQLLVERRHLDGTLVGTVSNSASAMTAAGIEAIARGSYTQPTGNMNVTNNNVGITGNVSNSAIAAGDGNVQSLSISQEHRNKIKNIVDEARTSLSDLKLNADDESDYNAHVNTIEGFLAEDKVQPDVVKKEIRALQRIGENAAGSFTGTGLYEAITAGLALFGSG